ncbi:hypothetical protein NMG60_11027522, partial [Bertholletia excelsa]
TQSVRIKGDGLPSNCLLCHTSSSSLYLILSFPVPGPLSKADNRLICEEKHIRTNRRARSVKSDIDQGNLQERASMSRTIIESGIRPLNFQPDVNESTENSNCNPNPNYDDTCWGYCTEEQLEEILLKNLEFLYNEAISKLVSLGYDEDVALKAILRNGHCYGCMDVLTNILHNAMSYLNSGCSGNSGNSNDSEPNFVDLRQLEEYSLAAMVCLLQQVRPHLSRGDAMWCLLMSDLHVGRASALCKFHGGWGFGTGGTSEFPVNGFLSYASQMTLQKEIECPKRFNLTPSMKCILRRNVAMFAAGFRANSKQFLTQSQACTSSLSNGDSPTAAVSGFEIPSEHNEELPNLKDQDVVNSNTEYVPEDQKDEMILSLVQQIKDLERQTQLLKKGKQTLEDTTMKRLSEMENSLRKASGQVDRANAAVRRLETENAEIRAEIEASKLSASESVANCLEVAKREKKCLRRLLAWEKQKSKLQEEIAAEKSKISELQQELVQIEAAQKEAEVKWREEQKAKELALAQVDEERRLKEATEANNKRKFESLRLKIEIDSQRHKDDLQRLEQELARLKASMQSTELHHQSDSLQVADSEGIRPQGETIARLLHELDKLEDSSDKDVGHSRECLICMKDEVSIVFLPCAHQVLCANCNEDYGKKGKATCPCCHVLIEQRIRVFGASS